MNKKNWTAEEISELLRMMRMLDVASLNTNIVCDGDELGAEIGDIIEDIGPGPQEILENNERIETLLKFIKQLPPRQEKIIMLRYGFYDGSPKTLDEIGNMYGVTRERIRQVEHKALAKLRWLITVKGKYRDINDL